MNIYHIPSVLYYILNFIPTADPATLTSIDGFVVWFRSTLATVGWVFPVTQFLTFVTTLIFIELALFLWHITKFLAKVLGIIAIITVFIGVAGWLAGVWGFPTFGVLAILLKVLF